MSDCIYTGLSSRDILFLFTSHFRPYKLVLICPHQLAARHEADPDGEGLTDLHEARLLVVRQGKCITEMLTLLSQLQKKVQNQEIKISDVHAEAMQEIQEMIARFNVSGGEAGNKVWLVHAESVKESIGPKAVSVKLLEAAVKQSKITMEETIKKKGANSQANSDVGLWQTRFEQRYVDLEEARGELTNAHGRLNDVRLTGAFVKLINCPLTSLILLGAFDFPSG